MGINSNKFPKCELHTNPALNRGLGVISILCCSEAWGGLEINIYKLCCWLQERGNSIVLIASENSKLANKAKKSSIEVAYLDLGKVKLLHVFSTCKLIEILKKYNSSNLIIGHYRQYNLAVWAKSFAFSIKVKLLYLQQMRMGVNRKNFYHNLYFSRIDAWLTPLQYLKDELRQNTSLAESQIRLHPLSCDISKFTDVAISKVEARSRLHLADSKFIVGIAGRLDKEKGQQYLIEAIKLLQDKNMAMSALIVGEESVGGTGYLEELKQKSTALGLNESIIFEPFTEDIAVFYKAIDIFAICSTNEPFGMVTVEAMLSGVPIVGANAGGTSEILGNGAWGNIFEPKNAKALAIELEKMYDNFTAATEKAIKAKADAATKYSHNTWCDSIENIFSNL